jgi:hypothetical protein
MNYLDKLRAERAKYQFAPYDVLQVTYDNGNRWDDYASIRTEAEADFAWQRTYYTRGQSDRFRIQRNQRTIYE